MKDSAADAMPLRLRDRQYSAKSKHSPDRVDAAISGKDLLSQNLSAIANSCYDAAEGVTDGRFEPDMDDANIQTDVYLWEQYLQKQTIN